MVFTTPFGNYYDASEGLKMCVSSWRRVEDNAIPPRAKIAGSYANAALIVTDAKNSGFDDAIVTQSSANVNVFIKSTELNSGEVAIITDVVREQLGVDIDKIIIIPSE